MMGQIVKRKKKGRPSKADLALRSPPPEIDSRRTLRRRNVSYNADSDDDQEFVEVEEETRREKKLELLMKPSHRGRPGARGGHAPSDGGSGSEEESESERKSPKRRRIDSDEDEEERGRKVESREADSLPGTPSELPSSGVLLPDKKKLELILDKLQKKDIYGVYAEPVDPEELPDYHDVIEHPMDFATVRNKLGNGAYTTLEQFENDVFLICSNAMQYNSSETIYHKQARSIQELARKKFHKLKVEYVRAEKEVKSEQKSGSNPFAKKQMQKPLCRSSQELISSDFTSGATLATAGDLRNSSTPTQASGCERPSNDDRMVDNIYSLNEITVEKTQLSSGKGLLSKFGNKLLALDENRRATYNISTQPVAGSESIFTTFEGEIKQLVAVGLHAEYSYARSLARFAATIGPVAWKIASRRIQQALPSDCKFGRGWVGEYEPPPTPVLVKICTQEESVSAMRLQRCSAGSKKDDEAFKTLLSPRDYRHPVNRPTPERKSPFSAPASGTRPSNPVHATYQQHHVPPKNFTEPQSKVLKQADLNSPSPVSQNNANPVTQRQVSNSSEMTASRGRETILRNVNALQSNHPFRQPHINSNGVVSGGLSNGKATIPALSNRRSSPSPDAAPNQMARTATYFPRGQEQTLTDPVQLMRMLAEKSQMQQKPPSQPTVETAPERSTVPSRSKDSTNAASVAARTWMSIGAASFKQPAENSSSMHKDQISGDSLYNPTREMHTQLSRVRAEFPPGGMRFQPAITGFPIPNTMQQVQMGNEAGLQNRPMIFPQFVSPTDLSRFQAQPAWRGLSPRSEPRQRQDMFPPDLNIGFPSPGSPARQQGVMVDSQQPDLALQL